MPAGEYAARVVQFLPGYLVASAIYVVAALGAQWAVFRVQHEVRPEG
jgi:hypothetical protein